MRGKTYYQVLHQYYEKLMTNPVMIMQRSALPEKVQREALTQEIIRIRRNTIEELRDKLKSEQMSKFAWKLYKSGYCRKERREILIAGLKGFQRLVELERKGIRSLNR